MIRVASPAGLPGVVGQSATGAWFEIDQDRIAAFAEATEDRQWIHLDRDRAASGPFGGTIAHGFLTLSLMPMLGASTDGPKVGGVKMGVNYGCNKVRFLSPVRSGKRVRSHVKLLELEEKRPGQWQQTNEVTVEIEGEEKPALIAEWISQFFV